jgi:hypothetical protein
MAAKDVKNATGRYSLSIYESKKNIYMHLPRTNLPFGIHWPGQDDIH